MFKRLDEDARPMPCPLFSSPLAPSPLPATPDSLRALADAVLEWGKTYSGEGGVRGGGLSQATASVSQVAPAVVKTAIGDHGGDAANRNGKDDDMLDGARKAQGDDDDAAASSANTGGDNDAQKPGVKSDDATIDNTRSFDCAGARADQRQAKSASSTITLTPQSSSTTPTVATTTTSTPTTTLPLACWTTGRFALEMQAPWAERLLDGEKTVETRGYPLPTGLVGRWIELIESQPGRDGVSALGDTVGAGESGLAAVGKVCKHFDRFFFFDKRDS